jgi:hypothetical protein
MAKSGEVRMKWSTDRPRSRRAAGVLEDSEAVLVKM